MRENKNVFFSFGSLSSFFIGKHLCNGILFET